MAGLKVTARQACYTADNRYIEPGTTFMWFGDVEQLPHYLEPAAGAEPVEGSQRSGGELSGEERSAAIVNACAKLDRANAEHWTTDGQPRMEVLHELTGDETITRAEVRAIAPECQRGAT